MGNLNGWFIVLFNNFEWPGRPISMYEYNQLRGHIPMFLIALNLRILHLTAY